MHNIRLIFYFVSVEYFIAKRSAESKSGGKPSIMVRVATISVALSVAIMIISLAIVFGFKREISSSLTGFISEAVVSQVATLNGMQDRSMQRDVEVEEMLTLHYGAQRVSPYATLQAIVRSDEGIEGVMIRGVDSLYDFDFLSKAIVAGGLPDFAVGSASRELLVSQSLAQRLALEVGDRLELILHESEGALRRDLFKISGLYSTGLDEWDRMVLITDLRNVQRLKGWREDQISGYETRFPSLAHASRVSGAVNEELFFSDKDELRNVRMVSSDELHPSIFDWLKAHNINALVIIIIMLIVAGFNMATALLIMVLERTRMIGVLKSMGMDNPSLQRIFLYRAFWITLHGLAWGNGVALSFCLLQHHFKFLKLDAASYLLRYVPIELGAAWIITLNVVAIVVILVLMIAPTRMVSKVKIEKTLKFE